MSTLDRLDSCSERATQGCVWALLNLMALVFFGVAGYFGWQSWELTQNGETTTGVVVGLDESDSDGSTVYAFIVEYVAADQRHTYSSSNYSSPPSYAVGDEVELLYDPADPKQVVINSWLELWGLTAGMLLGGVITFVVVNIFFWRR